VRGIFEFRPEHFQNALDVAENIVVPNPNCLVSEAAHRPIALGVGGTVGMLAAITSTTRCRSRQTKSAK
jgi:hypothetical protein